MSVPPPSGIVIVCALQQERAAILTGLGSLSQTIRVIAAGVGPRSAEKAARRLCAQGVRPALLISGGICGALDPALDIGAAVLGTEIKDSIGQFNYSHPATSEIAEKLSAAFSSAGFPLYQGAVAGSAQPVLSSADKLQLRERSGAIAVDMESLAFAKVCSEFGIPMLVLRTVSDRAGEDLPSELANFLDENGRPRYWPIIKFALSGGGNIAALTKLKTNCDAAAKSLETVFGIFAKLVRV